MINYFKHNKPTDTGMILMYFHALTPKRYKRSVVMTYSGSRLSISNISLFRTERSDPWTLLSSPLIRTNSLVPCEFEIERVYCNSTEI